MIDEHREPPLPQLDALELAGSIYGQRGFVALRQAIGKELFAFVEDYCKLLERSGAMSIELGTPTEGSLFIYGDRALDAVAASKAPMLGAIVGCTLVPTYSYLRIYRKGQALPAHRDRRACEHSLSVSLSASDWPLCLVDLTGEQVAVELEPGDAVLYRGPEVEHWRSPLTAERAVQLFLHFVDAEGQWTNEIYDRRRALGQSRSIGTPSSGAPQESQ